jgi:hypothetical protein
MAKIRSKKQAEAMVLAGTLSAAVSALLPPEPFADPKLGF